MDSAYYGAGIGKEPSMSNLAYILFLSTAASLDALAAGTAYGLKGIYMSVVALAVVCTVTVIGTGLGMVGADLLTRFIGPHVATAVGGVLLVALGTFRALLEYLTESPSPSGAEDEANGRRLSVSIGRLVITVMAKPEAADLDKSRGISPWEAALLGMALGVDNVVATSAASLGGLTPVYTPLAMGVVQTAFFAAGYYGSASLVSDRMKRRLPYVACAVLAILGIVRLL